MAISRTEESLSILSWDWGHTVRSLEVCAADIGLAPQWHQGQWPCPSFCFPLTSQVVTPTPGITSRIHKLGRKKGEKRCFQPHLSPSLERVKAFPEVLSQLFLHPIDQPRTSWPLIAERGGWKIKLLSPLSNEGEQGRRGPRPGVALEKWDCLLLSFPWHLTGLLLLRRFINLEISCRNKLSERYRKWVPRTSQ